VDEVVVKAHSLLKKLSFWIVIAVSLTAAQQKHNFSPREKAFYADAQTVEFVNPGLTIKVTGATIAANGTITVQYTLTDPTGLPLDSAGVSTPGTISTSFVAAYIPNGQEQYTAYTTRVATGTAVASVNQPGADSGGVTTVLGNGAYQYVFKIQAPAGFDPTATNTIGLYGSRTLTAYNLPNNYASTTFNFVPNGAKVTHTRDVIETSSCNQCHEQLSAHGGSRRGVNLCVMCHTPQNVDPNTGNTVDFKSFIHRIHMGSSLPSVVAGGTFAITTSFGVSNYSTVIDPSSAQRCEVCHQQTTGAAQATAFLTNPTRVACGSCHDDVNFATGANHPGGFQTDDTQCVQCHIPQGQRPFDSSIMGAHVVATDTAAFYPQNPDTLLSGLNLAITGVTNNKSGGAPVVAFTLLDNSKTPIALSALGSLSFTMAGPTTDFGYTIFGTSTGTPGYVTESALTAAKCDATGNCTYSFTNVIPAAAVGSYAIGGESRRTETLLAGTTSSQAVEYGAFNPVTYFSVNGSPVETRRTVVAVTNCNVCHVALAEHGTLRSNTMYCVMCHNPSNTDATTRATATVAADKAAPPQGINFNLLVHRIHDGVNVTANGGKPFIVVGFGGSHNDFSGVLFPGLSPTGTATDLENCAFCHVNSSEQDDLSLTGLHAVTDPQGLINPVQPIASACSGCHVDLPTASHFLSNTSTLGESCAVCHGTGGAFTVDSMHAQF
jgi:OmcA/MtrC family decaheme c-type cytochrome